MRPQPPSPPSPRRNEWRSGAARSSRSRLVHPPGACAYSAFNHSPGFHKSCHREPRPVVNKWHHCGLHSNKGALAKGRECPPGHRGPLPGGRGEDAGRCVRGAPQPGERHAGPTLPRALPSRENALLGDLPISGSPEGTWWSGTSGRWRTLDERFLGPPHLPPLLKEQRAPALRLPLATPPRTAGSHWPPAQGAGLGGEAHQPWRPRRRGLAARAAATGKAKGREFK